MKCEICGKDILNDSQCINYKYYHNDCIENLQQENKQLKENYERIYNENCKLREEHNITDISLLEENKRLNQKYLNAVADYELEKFNVEELKKQLEEVEFIVGLRQKRNLIHKFDKEYDEEDKKKNPNRDYAGIMPDAEEVYRRYYTMKNQQKEFINWLIENESLDDYCNKTTFTSIREKYEEIIGGNKDGQ